MISYSVSKKSKHNQKSGRAPRPAPPLCWLYHFAYMFYFLGLQPRNIFIHFLLCIYYYDYYDDYDYYFNFIYTNTYSFLFYIYIYIYTQIINT